MTENLPDCTICLRSEVIYDVISGSNVKTIEGYLEVNFEVALALIVFEILKTSFRDGGGGGGGARPLLLELANYRKEHTEMVSELLVCPNLAFVPFPRT